LGAINYDENNVYVLDAKTNSISTYTATLWILHLLVYLL
jgi:hypothetical protein